MQENLKTPASCTVEKNFSVSTKSGALKPFELDSGSAVYFLLLVGEQKLWGYNLGPSP